ncbi:hypothetical protein DVH24_026952 [Malus domestica]|uniref:non-specific serine/threonine protein kinase n=1 Tax=Malus domestica TaxID=3750 RepID=A0A498IS02_MALDO|nr:hypothetical protein DVH24_026952 [Malus domestica]
MEIVAWWLGSKKKEKMRIVSLLFFFFLQNDIDLQRPYSVTTLLREIMNMFFPRFLPHSLFFVACFVTFALGATRLPNDEVQTLKDIAKTLGKTNWGFSGDADPCSGQLPWTDLSLPKAVQNAISCNCSYESFTVCHITSIILRSQDLQGTLPVELVNLTYLQEIDLNRNYLSGTIPPEWSSLPLLNISLLGNRLTGSIPKELGDITTLKRARILSQHRKNVTVLFKFYRVKKYLVYLEFFFKSSTSLSLIYCYIYFILRLLSSNNFTGELPETFAMLTKIKDFRVCDSHFSGQIPDFIENWANLEKLLAYIPSRFLNTKRLAKCVVYVHGSILTCRRITDLSGPESPIPSLNKMKNMRTLMLRSCNLIGKIPPYLEQMNKLVTLDLSFNKLTGEIPSSFGSLPDVTYIDLSYNNLALEDASCQPQVGLDLFASSSNGNNLYYSLHINCGGKQFTVAGEKDTVYDDDTFQAGPSSFYQSSTNWALSSTGWFIDVERPYDTFIGTNGTRLSMANPQLYMNARLSPISLTYFGFCLGNGNYTVNLHFAEIMFRNGKTYKSLGRRIFDIYIQGKLVKDFNIMDEAGVFGDVVIKNFTAPVTNNTLEIRFYWAGKGTTAIPVKGVYGPLISAISTLIPRQNLVEVACLNSKKPRATLTKPIRLVRVVLVLFISGYMVPEYAMRGYLTDKANVYSFGILVLEVVSGRNNTTYRKKEESFYLLDWARLLKQQGNLMDLVDPRLGSDFNKEEMIVAINVALLCCNVTSTARPTMSSVVSMLEGKAAVQELVSDPKAESIEIDAMRKHFQSSFGRGTSEKRIEMDQSTEGPWTASSTSAHYL